jgi:hypothetical protein
VSVFSIWLILTCAAWGEIILSDDDNKPHDGELIKIIQQPVAGCMCRSLEHTHRLLREINLKSNEQAPRMREPAIRTLPMTQQTNTETTTETFYHRAP